MNTSATLQYCPEKHGPSFLSALLDAPEQWMGDLLYPVQNLIQEDSRRYYDLACDYPHLEYPMQLTWNTSAAGGDLILATILRWFLDLRYLPTLS